MQSSPPLEELMLMRHRPVFDVDGEPLGELAEVYYDKASGRPEWLGVDASPVGMKRVLVPVVGTWLADDVVHVAVPRQLAAETPEVLAREISQDLERRLYTHYGIRYSHEESPTGFSGSEPPPQPTRRELVSAPAPAVRQAPPGRPAATAESPARARLRRASPAKPVAAEGEGPAAALRRHPEAPWFAGAATLLVMSMIADRTRLRPAAMLLRIEALALLAASVIEKRRASGRARAGRG